jgi:TM2 domain-containing membrane protein YozV
LVLGLFDGHRFYLERHGTGLLMLLTGGGFMIWWVVDGFRVGRMARTTTRSSGAAGRATS